MKIILLRPPYICGKISFINSQFPLNIAYLASYLKKYGFQDVEIWDYEIEKYDDKKFATRLKDSKPDIIGISCFTPTITYGHRIATIIKQNNPEIITVVGGVHASALPEETLNNFHNFDYVIFGEGEKTFLKFCQLLRGNQTIGNLPGLAYRKNGTIIKNDKPELIEDLDNIPFPARELLKIEAYKGQALRGFSRDFLKITEILTSRGCPQGCIFCASNVVHGRRVRLRSAENVLTEVKECIKKYKFNHLCILDDNFIIDKNRLENLCEGFQKLKITWDCLAHINSVSREIIKMMEKSGCRGIAFGLESGSQRILQLINKNISYEQIINAFKWAHEVGIKIIEADFIIASHPSENVDELNESLKLIKKINPDIIAMSIATPYPGTELFRIMKNKNYISEFDWEKFLFYGARPVWRTEHFTSDVLLNIQKKILRNFYFNPKNILNKLRKTESIGEFYYYLKVGVNFLRRF